MLCGAVPCHVVWWRALWRSVGLRCLVVCCVVLHCCSLVDFGGFCSAALFCCVACFVALFVVTCSLVACCFVRMLVARLCCVVWRRVTLCGVLFYLDVVWFLYCVVALRVLWCCVASCCVALYVVCCMLVYGVGYCHVMLCVVAWRLVALCSILCCCVWLFCCSFWGSVPCWWVCCFELCLGVACCGIVGMLVGRYCRVM